MLLSFPLRATNRKYSYISFFHPYVLCVFSPEDASNRFLRTHDEFLQDCQHYIREDSNLYV